MQSTASKVNMKQAEKCPELKSITQQNITKNHSKLHPHENIHHTSIQTSGSLPCTPLNFYF